MKSQILLVPILLASKVLGLGGDDFGGLPIIAIWAHPSNASTSECGGDCEFVKAAYVKWLESAGVRALPIRFDAPPEEVRPILEGANGLLLPGGTPSLPSSARWAINFVYELNKLGDYFPVWGTCLGWEWMAEALAGDFPVVTDGFDAENFTQPLGLLAAAQDSRMFSGVPEALLRKASTEPLTANAHHKGVEPSAFAKSGLNQIFRKLAVNADRRGRRYISAVEAFDFPVYGLQWHPEKSQFEWGLDSDGTLHHAINHSADAIELSQSLAMFFASEARRSRHLFPSLPSWEPYMFHNLAVTPTGPSTGQRYIFRRGAKSNAWMWQMLTPEIENSTEARDG